MIHLHSGLFSNYATCIEDTDFQIHNKATVTVYSYFFSAIYPAASPLLQNMLFPQWGEIFSPHYPSVREKLPSGSQPAANRIINSHSAAKLALGQPEMVMLTHKKSLGNTVIMMLLFVLNSIFPESCGTVYKNFLRIEKRQLRANRKFWN